MTGAPSGDRPPATLPVVQTGSLKASIYDRPVSSRRLRGTALTLLLTLTISLLTCLQNAPASATTDDSLLVQIDELSPALMFNGAEVNVQGTITNSGTEPWTQVQAYLVRAQSPFTTREQIETSIANGASYTGERVIEFGNFDEVGDLAPGATIGFDVTVPYELLQLTGAEGIYPIGIQILATDWQGNRSNNAVARATTFLPWISDQVTPVAAGTVWTFAPPEVGSVGRAELVGEVLNSIATDGLLNRQLDIASQQPADARTMVIDPAILDLASEIANRTRIPQGIEISDEQAEEAGQFLNDLVTLLRNSATWVIDYGRPDYLALVETPNYNRTLLAAIDSSTESALARHQVSGRRVTWPSDSGLTPELLSLVQRSGENPALVSSAGLDGWEARHGTIVSYRSSSGVMPLAVNNVLSGVPGAETTTTVRQRILADAALASLSRSFDSASRADAVSFIDPQWDPGPDARASDLREASSAAGQLTTGATLDDLLQRHPLEVPGMRTSTPVDLPLGAEQVEVAAELAEYSEIITSVVTSDDAVVALDRGVAESLSIRGRADQAATLRATEEQVERLTTLMGGIALSGPENVMLSSEQGNFPLTVSNDTDYPVRVGIALGSSNPALSLPSIAALDIQPGERRTLTAEVDVGQQASTTVTASLVSETGEAIGEPVVFNIRSSNVGLYVWISIGFAALLLAITLTRRFGHRRRTKRETAESTTTEAMPHPSVTEVRQ